MTDTTTIRPGELAADCDPASMPPDAGLVFIGVAHTPWRRGNCPKGMRAAREEGRPATLDIAEPWRPALSGLKRASHVIVLGWLQTARRDLLVQSPIHAKTPSGTFALRSPARPNPIGVSVARLVRLNVGGGVIELDALDWFDGTPLLDIKPYFPGNDAIPDATVGEA